MILDATNAMVVVSSSRRGMVHEGEMSLAGLEFVLRSHGIRCSVVGVTEADLDADSDWRITRGRQISNYLKEHASGCRYVVLDDEDDGISARGLNFVRVNGSVGLTEADAERAIEMLKGAA